MLWWFVDIAAACSGPLPEVRLLAAPREGLGVWIEAVATSPDFTLEIDGVPVDGALREIPDPAFGSTFALFAPQVPLVEGQSWRFTPSEWIDEAEVLEGLVGPAGPPEAPALVAVDLGERVDGRRNGCLESIWYRVVDFSVSEGEGLVVLEDERTGEGVRALFAAGEPVDTFFLREGRSGRRACLTPTVLLADGSETTGDTVCSDGARPPGSGGCGGAGSLAASPLVALPFLRGRPRRRAG